MELRDGEVASRELIRTSYITYGQKPEGPAPAPVSPEAPLSPA